MEININKHKGNIHIFTPYVQVTYKVIITKIKHQISNISRGDTINCHVCTVIISCLLLANYKIMCGNSLSLPNITFPLAKHFQANNLKTETYLSIKRKNISIFNSV
jgi:hypothetical protein